MKNCDKWHHNIIIVICLTSLSDCWLDYETYNLSNCHKVVKVDNTSITWSALIYSLTRINRLVRADPILPMGDLLPTPKHRIQRWINNTASNSIFGRRQQRGQLKQFHFPHIQSPLASEIGYASEGSCLDWYMTTARTSIHLFVEPGRTILGEKYHCSLRRELFDLIRSQFRINLNRTKIKAISERMRTCHMRMGTFSFWFDRPNLLKFEWHAVVLIVLNR